MTGKKFINGLNFAIITILLVIALSACSVSKQEEQPDNTNNALQRKLRVQKLKTLMKY